MNASDVMTMPINDDDIHQLSHVTIRHTHSAGARALNTMLQVAAMHTESGGSSHWGIDQLTDQLAYVSP